MRKSKKTNAVVRDENDIIIYILRDIENIAKSYNDTLENIKESIIKTYCMYKVEFEIK